MVAGILKLCGAWLGKPLLMGAKDNPKGHFENKRFINLNDRILRSNKGTWNSPPKIVNFRGHKKEMKRFLLNIPDKTAVLKDPRTAFTFNLWRQLIPAEKIKIIYIKRSKEAVAKSLKKRNGFNLAKGRSLSDRYNREIKKHLAFFPEHKICECDYNEFFGPKKKETVLNICRLTGLKEPDNKTWNKINEFITPELRHWK